MTKQQWRQAYRHWRIVRREQAKADRDMLLFGVGFTRTKDGHFNHVLPQAVIIGAEKSAASLCV